MRQGRGLNRMARESESFLDFQHLVSRHLVGVLLFCGVAPLMRRTGIEPLIRKSAVLLFFLLFSLVASSTPSSDIEVVTFPSGELTLHGVLYRPEGVGPFPAVVYNHGSAPGMLSKEAFDALGPVFANNGWVFFGPYRRGQGLIA